jgi:hypothetical protein
MFCGVLIRLRRSWQYSQGDKKSKNRATSENTAAVPSHLDICTHRLLSGLRSLTLSTHRVVAYP